MSADRPVLEAIWQVMVELAEAGNDEVVSTQVVASKYAATNIAGIASDLAVLAQAAAVLARRIGSAP